MGWRMSRSWRKLSRRQLAILLSLTAILVASISVTALVIRPAAATPTPAHVSSRHSGPRDAGAYFQLRHYGQKRPAPDARSKALAQATKIPRLQVKNPRVATPSGKGAHNASVAATPSFTSSWTPLGPAPSMKGTQANTGRITALAVDPNNANVIWVGTADGGVWRSTDGGSTYTSLSDGWDVLSVGSIAVDPNDPQTVYVGTGEGNLSGDSYWGVGIYKTIDGDQETPTWTRLGFDKFGGLSVTKLAINPTDGTDILAAVTWSGSTNPPGGGTTAANGGIWQSTDSGTSWAQVLKGNSSPNLDYGTDVVFDPTNTNVAYAGLANVLAQPASFYSSGTSKAGVYKSVDGGATWGSGPLATGITNNADIERVSLSIARDGSKLYAVFTNGDTTNFPSSPNFGTLLNSKIYVYDGTVFTNKTLPAAMANDEGNQQYWYNSFVGVDPTSPTTVFVGGADAWKTSNGGTSWTNITNPGGVVHADQHAIAFPASAATPFVGNDGGVWQYSGTSFANKNGTGAGTLNITPFYGGGYGDLGSSAKLYGGAQSNGELQFPKASSLDGPATWSDVGGIGDGGYTAVDYTNNAVVYEEDVFGAIRKSTNGGTSWSAATSGINGNDPVSFIMPFIISPNTHTTLFAGTDRVYRTTNAAGSWAAIGPHWGIAISALAVAPGNDNVIYAATGDRSVGSFFYSTTDGGAHWSSGLVIPGSTAANSGGGILTGLTVDPQHANIVYATFSAFAPGAGGHVFRSTDNGQHWTDISATLPNIPFESVLVTPGNSNLLIAGSDAGVFASEDQGASWYTLGTGLPNVAINQLFASHDGTKLFVATHGRGMWTLAAPALQISSTAPITATVPVGSTTGGVPGAYSQVITVTNGGSGSTAMNWSVDTTGQPSCLTISPSAGALAAGMHTDVTLSVDTSTAGICAFNVTVQADGLISSFTVPVAVEVSNLSTSWYFAEGYTGTGFDEWLTLANPGGTAASVQVTFLIQDHAPVVQMYTVNAKSRFTVKVNNEIGSGKRVSMAIASSQPIIAERPMYVRYGLGSSIVPGGTSLMGTTSLGTDYYFGYVDTTPNHDTWFTILNQNDVALDVTIDYYQADGTKIEKVHDNGFVAAHSRGSLKVNDEGLPAGTYSAKLHFSAPALVERPMYFKDASTGRPGITDVLGVSAPQTSWYFAEGQTDSTHRELYVLSNPSETDTATVHVVFYGDNGSQGTHSDIVLAPKTQFILNASTFAGLTGTTHGAAVTANHGILVDRYISQRFVGPLGTATTNSTVDGATDSTGTSVLGQAYYFAEGYTGGKSAEFLELANPDATQDATVTVSYLPSNGSAAKVVVYTVPAHSQLRITTSTVMKGTSFSMAVLSNRGIVAERTMEFIYGMTTGSTITNVPGANVAVGYQP